MGYLFNGGNSHCKTSANDKLDEAEKGRSPDVNNELDNALHCSQTGRVYSSARCQSWEVGRWSGADLRVNAMRAPSMVARTALVIWTFARSAKKRGRDAPMVAACSAARQLAWRVFFASATRS